jgi:hypothetical protein
MKTENQALLYMRDVYAQLKSLRRVLNATLDDMGDLTLNRNLADDVGHEIGELQDALTDIECKLHKMQERFAELSRGDK